MNERIKELAKVAEQLADDELAHLERVHNRLYSFTEGREIYNQKFAELIIADCASICKLNGQSYKHSFTPAKARLAESTSNHCGLMIGKHFGVEE